MKSYLSPSKKPSEPAKIHGFTKNGLYNSGVEFVDKRPEPILQARMQNMADHFSASFDIIQKKENQTGLPDNLKSGIENLSGYSMDDVKVHYDSSKPAQLNAHAYAQGTDIHLATGQEKHLAHEAWHVVQQKQGRVQSTKQLKGKVNINDDAGLEKEADVMGSKALQTKVSENQKCDSSKVSNAIVQKYQVSAGNVVGNFTSQVSRNKLGGGKTFLNNAGNAANLETKISSKVRIALTGKMAIEDSVKGERQAKFFYADNSRLLQANAAMLANNSPISFIANHNTITVQDQGGANHVLNKIIPIMNAGKDHEARGTDIRLPENCNEAACKITGTASESLFDEKYKVGSGLINAPTGSRGRDVVPRLAAFLPAYLKVKEYEESSGFSKLFTQEPKNEKDLMTITRDRSTEGRDQITGYKDGLSDSKLKASQDDMQDRIGGQYAQEFLKKPGSKEIIDTLGINESAAPDAGDALAIYSIGKDKPSPHGGFQVMDYRTEQNIQKPAPYHYATVVARSGSDYITMENYVRKNEEADGHEPAMLDPRYFFRMYGPEVQSFHSENVDRFPNALTLALTKPVQLRSKTLDYAPIQLNGEAEKAMEDVHKQISKGPGNLTNSSEEAKENFDVAGQLEKLLLKQPIGPKGEDFDIQSIDALGRDALYRKEFMNEKDSNTVNAHVQKSTGGQNRVNKLKSAKEMTKLTEAVWRAFVLKKTGGGSCDHISAATYINLLEKGKEPVLIRYAPQSDEKHKITAPDEHNKHRSVIFKDKEQTVEVDSWFPEKGRVQIFASANEAEAKLKDYEAIWKWQPDEMDFVKAVQKELELRYQHLEKTKLIEKMKGNAANIILLWKIENL